MSGINAAYRSRDPEVVQAWIEATDAITAYVRNSQRVLDAYGLARYQCYRNGGGWNPGAFAGLAIPDREKPPAGWRMLSQYAVPDKRTKAGKQVDAALEAVKHPGDPLFKLIGMPPDVMTGSGFSGPAVRLLEDRTAVYVGWGTDPAGGQSFFNGKVEIDLDRWERIPLSAYYLASEQADTARAGAA